MDEPDFSNPLVVITGFFAVMFTALAFLVKVLPIAFATGGLFGLVAGVVGSMGAMMKILLE